MGGHTASIGTVILGLAAVGIGGWPAFQRRSQTLYRSPGIWSYGSTGMIGLVVLGVGLVMVGGSFLVETAWIARIMTWTGVVVAIVGGAVYVVNPKLRMKS